jgi:anti-sigma factor (TIGR02949 family)
MSRDQEFAARPDGLITSTETSPERGSAMDCETVRQILFLYADNEMDQELCSSFAAHIGSCPECQREVSRACRLVMVVRTSCRCLRLSAPPRLRVRILKSLPHRQGTTP